MNAKSIKTVFYPSYSPGVPNTVSLLQGFRPCGKNLFKRCLQNNCKIFKSNFRPYTRIHCRNTGSALYFVCIVLHCKDNIRMIKSSSKAFKILCNALVNILTAVSLLYFGFMLLWGINYQRLPFSQIANYDTSPASTDELLEVCKSLMEHANRLRKHVEEDNNGL